MDSTEGALFFDTILSRIQGDIESTAKDLYFDTCSAISISLDDLIQEGMVGAWIASKRYDASKVKSENSMNGYCMKYARYAMLQWIENHKSEISLEAYLEVETERGLMQRDIEDKPVKSAEIPKHKREAVLNALKKIGPKQRTTVIAAFQIEDEQGHITTREDIGMTHTQYTYNKAMALKNLRTIITDEGSQIQNVKTPLIEQCYKLLSQDPTIKSSDLMRLTGCSIGTVKRAIIELRMKQDISNIVKQAALAYAEGNQ